MFEVVRPRRRLPRAVGTVLGFPAAGQRVPVQVVIERSGSGEVWRRRFGDHWLVSHQRARGDQLVESVGCVELILAVRAEEGTLRFSSEGVRLSFGRLRLRVPRRLALRVDAAVRATTDGRRMHVAVNVAAPILGTLLAYGGELTERDQQ